MQSDLPAPILEGRVGYFLPLLGLPEIMGADKQEDMDTALPIIPYSLTPDPPPKLQPYP